MSYQKIITQLKLDKLWPFKDTSNAITIVSNIYNSTVITDLNTPADRKLLIVKMHNPNSSYEHTQS